MTTNAATPSPTYFIYGHDIEREIHILAGMIQSTPSLYPHYHPRWLAIQLLESDPTIQERVRNAEGGTAVLEALGESLARLERTYGDEAGIVLADQRYQFIHRLVQAAVRRPAQHVTTISDRIDAVVTHRLFGIPIFLGLMWIVFKVTTDVASPLVDWVDQVIHGPITSWIIALLGIVGLGGTWVERLVVDGIIAGVGGILVFVPVLAALYLALALLEDSGYMARAAFVMDRLMRTLGLHGKSFLPMLIGFGCTVPALYATRTLENHRDRVLTGLLVPFMSCGARLPVYVLLAAIFFPATSGWVIWGIYMLGIITAVVLGIVLRRTLFKSDEHAPFIMELPPYRFPTLRNIWMLVWSRTSSFLKKAWTVIMATSIVIWLLIAIPVGKGTFAHTELDQSGFAFLAQRLAPLFSPLGFGSWEASGALVTGFVAKEVIVSTMAQVYRVDGTAEESSPTTVGEDLRIIAHGFGQAVIDALKAIPSIVGINLTQAEEEQPQPLMQAIRDSFEASSGGHGKLAALAFMVFVLLYTPCMVAVAAEWQELGSRWAWTSIIGQLVLAWVAALLVFQGGKFLSV